MNTIPNAFIEIPNFDLFFLHVFILFHSYIMFCRNMWRQKKKIKIRESAQNVTYIIFITHSHLRKYNLNSYFVVKCVKLFCFCFLLSFHLQKHYYSSITLFLIQMARQLVQQQTNFCKRKGCSVTFFAEELFNPNSLS